MKLGCIGCVGIDFVKLGEQTGKMAAKVLKGEKKASEIPFETFNQGDIYLNEKTAKDLGIKLPPDVKKEAVETFTEIKASK